jgi:ABC-2 type transport system permease protein
MNRWHPFRQLVLSRLRDFYREPVALFWVYGFPLILAVALGIAFSNRKPDPSTVDVEQAADETLTDDIVNKLTNAGLTVSLHSAAECAQRLKTGKTALYLVPSRLDNKVHLEFVYDEARPESDKARYQVEYALYHGNFAVGETKRDDPAWTSEYTTQGKPGSRYIDFLMPGLIGMNLMGGGMWGIGFVLVEMRVRKLLKRFLATPMHRGHFLLAMLSARMILLIPEMTLLVLFSIFVLGVPLDGNPLTLMLVIFIGAAAFTGMGLLIACRTEKTETVSGLMNLVMLPQWLLSGAFFSSKRFPAIAQPVIEALPLTQLIDALREVMLEGAGLPQVGWRLCILAAWGIGTFALALKWFRWR